MSYQAMVAVTRDDLVESTHSGALALADVNGKLHAAWGDPEHVTYLRSSAKPLQVLPLLEQGAMQAYDLSLKQIALMCASHAGTDAHAHTAASIQTAVGVGEQDLLCGTHPPGDAATARRLQCNGEAPSPNRHNCSGKHSGMLAMARMLGENIEAYVDPQHPVQRRILQALGEMSDMNPEHIGIGVDGCSAPVFAMPLRNAATAYARLADPSRLEPARASACRTIFQAMNSHPEMVAGDGFFDTELMRVGGGKLICKIGAEGYYGVGLAPGTAGPNAPAMGLALKIADGDLKKRARPLAVLTVLQAFGVLDEAQMRALRSFGPRAVTNWRGLHVGEIRAVPEFQGAMSKYAV